VAGFLPRGGWGELAMKDKAQEYRRNALQGREKAIVAGDSRHKTEWLVIARMWEELARESEKLHDLHESIEAF
jgi:hypothetical protein